jgi:hypothetical protein
MLKITDANNYEELEQYLLYGEYSISYVTGKINWFTERDTERYESIIMWLQRFKDNYKQDVLNKQILQEYFDLYGATKAVIMLKKDKGLVTTRQNIYKRLKGDSK